MNACGKAFVSKRVCAAVCGLRKHANLRVSATLARSTKMDRLHIELIATRPLDFRDAPRFAAMCTAARSAILSGPLHLWTDIERIITLAQLERLLKLLAWCGQSVRSLRLDQQPRVLWAKDAIARAERAGTDDTTGVRRDAQEKAMEQMPKRLRPTRTEAMMTTSMNKFRNA